MGSILLTWINLSPDMDMWLHAQIVWDEIIYKFPISKSLHR